MSGQGPIFGDSVTPRARWPGHIMHNFNREDLSYSDWLVLKVKTGAQLGNLVTMATMSAIFRNITITMKMFIVTRLLKLRKIV